MKKKRQGFTLIELLAVIVILGLLMAIAIPSVTKYITESRKKTLTTTIGNYTSALVADVNNMEYVFTETNTIYAVPIECISLERGGTNPFGEWSPATENHWAYVLVQYDDKTSSYTYGFTFKDSAGYGLYPTTLEKLKESGKQIVTGLSLNKPKGGTYKSITEKNNWTGFEIDDNTKIAVLEKKDNGLCEIIYPCISSGNNIGNTVICGNDEFYIIENNSSTITMLTKEKINLTTHKQDTSAAHIVYSLYWDSGTGLKPDYGAKYPAYVYDSNSNLYKYIEYYEESLKNMGVNSTDAQLITSDQLVNNLKCTNYNCNNSPYSTWLIKSYSWWTGTATSRNCLWHVDYSGRLISNIDCQGYRAIRPIITVSKSEIKFN